MTIAANEQFRSGCPIASTLDLVGDKWSLVIVRDMINGKSRFAELTDSPERIPTNILTNRLRRMEALGLIERRAYSEKPPRFEYILTGAGQALHPVLQSICTWANGNLADRWIPPEDFMR